MEPPQPQPKRWLSAPILSPGRIWLAFGVAAAADFVQLVLGPAGWFVADEVVDVIAMVSTCAAIGFHPLLLPTFVIEFIPVADMLPTWTGCVAAVVMLRHRAQRREKPARAEVIVEPPPVVPSAPAQLPGPGPGTPPGEQ